MTITKASRKERTNLSASAGTGYTIPALTVTSGRTFIMTDLVFSTNFWSYTLRCVNDGGEGVRIYDSASQATPTAAQMKLMLNGNPHIITDMQNGPEFAVAVGAELVGNRALPTYAIFVGGYER